MKKVYEKPSMAMNSFDMKDNTNVNILSSVGAKAGTEKYSRIGINIIDGTGLKLNS